MIAQRYTGSMHFKRALQSIFLAATASFLALPALAQWQWIDKDGRKVFSDRLPPAEIRDKDILKRPGSRPASALASPVNDDAGALANAPGGKSSAAAMPRLSGKDKELEARKRQAEVEEALKKKAEEDKLAETRADTCGRAKRALATLESGMRIGLTNAAGEREVMDDAKRANEIKRTRDVADSSCK